MCGNYFMSYFFFQILNVVETIKKNFLMNTAFDIKLHLTLFHCMQKFRPFEILRLFENCLKITKKNVQLDQTVMSEET